MKIDWLTPWYEVENDASRESLRAELLREVPPAHVLRGITTVNALGYRKDQDDVVFILPDGRLAVVHLTWARREAMPPDLPARLQAKLECGQEVARVLRGRGDAATCKR